ncbi:hypothetical protein B0H10DRAFT_1413830 [Mycena sp. CBHHK59/15]|nr:hypothetical protein B0H10DRAFT_1413830 [Mycena sp. CBHHK59/15]
MGPNVHPAMRFIRDVCTSRVNRGLIPPALRLPSPSDTCIRARQGAVCRTRLEASDLDSRTSALRCAVPARRPSSASRPTCIRTVGAIALVATSLAQDVGDRWSPACRGEAGDSSARLVRNPHTTTTQAPCASDSAWLYKPSRVDARHLRTSIPLRWRSAGPSGRFPKAARARSRLRAGNGCAGTVSLSRGTSVTQTEWEVNGRGDNETESGLTEGVSSRSRPDSTHYPRLFPTTRESTRGGARLGLRPVLHPLRCQLTGDPPRPEHATPRGACGWVLRRRAGALGCHGGCAMSVAVAGVSLSALCL